MKSKQTSRSEIDGGEFSWYNLGYWHGTKDYFEAARNLARMVGQKAQFHSHDRVLDIGVGSGAQVPLWQHEFQLTHITAIEPSFAAWRQANSHASGTVTILCQKFENWQPEAGELINKVVCVDALYHIPHDRFWSALARLPDLEMVVVTDIYLLRPPKNVYESCCLSAIALMTGVPRKNFRIQARYQADMAKLGICEWCDISEEVIDGFCQKMREVPVGHLPLLYRLKPVVTGCILRWLRRRLLIGYALISLRIKPPGEVC